MKLDKSNPAEATWLSAVEAHEARGLSRTAAVRQVDHEQPSLRPAMVAAYNARVANKGEEEAGLVAKGVSKQQATGRVIAAQPDLHRQYLAAYNARLRRRKAV